MAKGGYTNVADARAAALEVLGLTPADFQRVSDEAGRIYDEMTDLGLVKALRKSIKKS